ncbi:Cardiolipin synthase (CMP-forming)-mitochondrial [Striga hermonthica]|uniref:Cardiolipin synthase (CMP-forming)-mitochondrial n=1 Tax=Striga hermonthica TaxID=68872 RepID=A0A9N7RLH2_STRHE|nr:Cardiolipin synthase (CMP-forming)-mitochondrial [Striga hermonthica]
MAFFRSLKTLASQSRRKNSSSTPSSALFSLGNSSPSPTQAPPFRRPISSHIRRHFLFRSRFISPVRGPQFLYDPPWRLSQSVAPFLVQSDVVPSLLKLPALNLLHRLAFPYNLGYDARLLFQGNGREEFTKRDDLDGGVGGGGIRESYLNIPNFISFARLLSGPVLGWMIVQEMYSSAFVGLSISGATDWVNTVFQLALVAAALLQPGFGNEETQLYISCLSWLVASTTVASTAAYGVQHLKNRAASMKTPKSRT